MVEAACMIELGFLKGGDKVRLLVFITTDQSPVLKHTLLPLATFLFPITLHPKGPRGAPGGECVVLHFGGALADGGAAVGRRGGRGCLLWAGWEVLIGWLMFFWWGYNRVFRD